VTIFDHQHLVLGRTKAQLSHDACLSKFLSRQFTKTWNDAWNDATTYGDQL
jgi:hypothetical protein